MSSAVAFTLARVGTDLAGILRRQRAPWAAPPTRNCAAPDAVLRTAFLGRVDALFVGFQIVAGCTHPAFFLLLMGRSAWRLVCADLSTEKCKDKKSERLHVSPLGLTLELTGADPRSGLASG
jgi:hypothetical protein